jgi:hypothetical protein
LRVIASTHANALVPRTRFTNYFKKVLEKRGPVGSVIMGPNPAAWLANLEASFVKDLARK